MTRRQHRLKRLIDISGAALVLAVTSPALLIVAVTVAVTLGRPVLFRQTRPGLHGRPFRLVKFRTMRPVDERRGLVSENDRLTTAGRILRATSLDELPTMWNVLCGHMSLVGPRPLLMAYLDRYTPEQARRHEVRPGVTGLAQVRGRNAISWDRKFALDVWYVDHRNLALDLRILAATVGAVIRRTGVAAQGEATAPEFLGLRETAGLTGPGAAEHPRGDLKTTTA
ncbi:sugar transferase [Actinoplanes sp. NPDC049548]|uniref:sugar transferase n=1 Tax=Actinoplanes sp. NPDC049548 TaxID=3155152 RepID=UPI00342B4D18